MIYEETRKEKIGGYDTFWYFGRNLSYKNQIEMILNLWVQEKS